MPSKYDSTTIYNTYIKLVEPRIDEIEYMVCEGYTFPQIAKELYVDNSLLYAMIQNKANTRLRSAFSFKRHFIHNVEMSLYRRSIGFFIEEEKPMIVKRTYIDKRGNKGTQEVVQKVKVSRYIEPDIQAIKFLLINKDPDNYHGENAKPVDDSMEKMLDKTSEILVAIKNKADEVSDSTEPNETEETNDDNTSN